VGAVAELITLLVTLATATVIGPGALAPAEPGCLSRVEMTRLRHGYHLHELGGPGVVKVAVAECGHLGKRGWLVASGMGVMPAYVVDCEQAQHAGELEGNGLLADVQPGFGLGHRRAVLVLWNE